MLRYNLKMFIILNYFIYLLFLFSGNDRNSYRLLMMGLTLMMD